MNLRTFSLVTAPLAEPVTLEEVKAYCKVDGTSEDTLLQSLMATARRACEEYTKRAFITQTWKMVMDRFCDVQEDSLPWLCRDTSIKLSREPIQSISSIKTTNTANTQSTVAPATYTLDPSSGRILLNDGYSWLSDLRANAAVEVEYVCGYGVDGSKVPEPLKQAILLYVNQLYANRACGELPEMAKSLLAPFCAMEAFVA